jgi:hypothetical protein
MASNGLCAVRSSVAENRERTVRSTRAAEAVAELGSFSLSTEVIENTSVAVGPVGGLPAVLSVV